jgi:hypothetical protein
MLNDFWVFRGKLILGLLLTVSVCGFFYFEQSAILRTLIVILSLISFSLVFFYNSETPTSSNRREILVVLILYLGIFSLYNLLYGLGIQLYLIMIAVWLLVTLLFIGLLILDRMDKLVSKTLFSLFACLNGLVILEVFLSLSFWPIDPKIKSLVLVVIFYLVVNLFYLYANNMLRFKKTFGYILISLIILALSVLNVWLSFKGGQ